MFDFSRNEIYILFRTEGVQPLEHLSIISAAELHFCRRWTPTQNFAILFSTFLEDKFSHSFHLTGSCECQRIMSASPL